MIETHEMTEEEFNRTVLGVIHREFGLGGLARFIRLNRFGSGDYTRDRHKWQSNLTLEDIWRDMEAKGLTQSSRPKAHVSEARHGAPAGVVAQTWATRRPRRPH